MSTSSGKGEMVKPRIQLCIGCGLSLLLLLVAGSTAQARTPHVVLMQLTGRIDTSFVPYARRVLKTATAQGAEAVIVHINTPGGRADAAMQIRDALLDADIETIAFIDKEAYSAGALIALACQRIYMASGGVIGAAAPVSVNGAPVSEKYISAIRKLFRATAEHRGRPPRVAEAMVDTDVAVPNLVQKDKLLTLTTQEALLWKVVDGQVASVDALVEQRGWSTDSVETVPANWAERLVRILTLSPIPAILLILGLLALWAEVLEPGIGVGALIGVISLGLFFGSHHLAGLAGWEEALLLGAGLLLLAIELFVTPGFGVFGGLGCLALGAGFYFSFLGHYPSSAEVWGAGLSVLAAFILVAIGVCASLLLVTFTPLWTRLGLRTQLAPGAGASAAEEIVPLAYWLGAEGVTVTPLMPSGAGIFVGKRLDIVSEGNYIPADTPVKIVHVEGHRMVVRAHALSATDSRNRLTS